MVKRFTLLGLMFLDSIACEKPGLVGELLFKAEVIFPFVQKKTELTMLLKEPLSP